ncbi:type I-F CRISPR-associated helicase Cas3f [Acidithiobacillus montserratensis]|uniref:Type I-F CRISPR-associated helicase Cas3f n=1 Tax=Acidithiobacillus montserratensis TaxID=2729135 RepID=A0ACD5HHZ5_9PROT|nr:type I-F CRISPR-associated helicase Cas3f [Acidithiobacillus montserratensis]MBU2746590.1 type I-F CRISPR-associated helicase Cas3 [Acidithiobacillus montserratensis]
MDVVLISACQKNAIRRTRAVLDRYAFRMGDSTWSTPITQEGLHSLQVHLRATASKNTSVLCLRNDRKQGLIPIWVVGSRARFGEDWRTPVFVTESKAIMRTRDSDTPSWVGTVKRIAAMSGLFHDLGKNNRFFAQKILQNGPIADPVRHEWISTNLVLSMVDSGLFDVHAAWDEAMKRAQKTNLDIRLTDCKDALSAVLFCVTTHHRMLNEEKNSRFMNAANMLNQVKLDKERNSVDPVLIRERAAAYPDVIVNKVSKSIRRLCEPLAGCEPVTPPARSGCELLGGDDGLRNANPLYWRAIAFLSRVALILADHQVSSLRRDQGACADTVDSPPFANSFKDRKGRRQPNQTLQWHLQSVGNQSAAMVDRIFHLDEDLEGASPESLSGIQQPASGRFQWQEDAAQAIRKARLDAPQKPFLLNVISGTGSGKTRACARLAAGCSTSDKVRFTAIFNLRTLTLQTGTAYRSQLGIQEADMAVVIGDAMTRKAYEAQQAPDNEDDMDRDLGGDIEILGMDNALTEWLTHFVKDDPNLKNLIAAPVFVSTADYLVPAGDPTAQGRHIMPLLRLMSSDLILDEIDNYGGSSVSAILRLVHLAGLFGRSVIASSATMTPALADALAKHYEHGASMRAALNNLDKADFGYGVISDKVKPSITLNGSADSAAAVFREHLNGLQAAIQNAHQTPRKAMLIDVERNEAGFKKAIVDAVSCMHETQSWADPYSGKPISVGLVRVANISTAIMVSKMLRDSSLSARVVCYHSQLFNGQRMMLERDLDHILWRGENPFAPAEHPSVRRHMEQADSGLFIVVATPVEEVGRDHDFDWAIIEPSSTQSIVQCAGRVHRHRHDSVQHPNVGILRFNLRACLSDDKPAFTRPGNETTDNAAWFGNHDMSELMDWNALRADRFALDARLRFDIETHIMAQADERALQDALHEPLLRMTGTNALWMSLHTYQNWPLRGKDINDEWRYDPDQGEWYRYQKTDEWKWMPQSANCVKSNWKRHAKSWLCPTHSEIMQFSEENGLPEHWAFTVHVPSYKSDSVRNSLQCSVDGFDF